jgi:glutamate/aspartate transport system substrate-binding protein
MLLLPFPTLRASLAALVVLTACSAAHAAPPAPAASASAASGPVIDRLRQGAPLVIAHRESSVPFSYFDADKKPVGYAVDICLKLADAIRRELGLKTLPVAFKPVTPANRIAVIEQHEADLECGATTNNAERRQKVAFTVPHYITGTRFMVRADSKLEELPQFEGRKLVSTKGTTPLKVIEQANRERLLGIHVLEAPDHVRAVEMVEKGEADGFAMDDVQLYGLIAGRPDPARLKVVGKLQTVEPLAIMLPKDDPVFKHVVDDEMKRLIHSQEAYALYQKWFEKPIPPKGTSLNLPMNYLLRDFWKYPTDQVPF